MEPNMIYEDIAKRTGGDIYIGVVGPVRCGKSTFIKKFMEEAVIPGITDEYDRKKATDELPQSSGGKTVMTTEPKFIPDEAVSVSFSENSTLKVKMIDCVGYMIPEALGATEEGNVRMVKTPWSEELLPFEEAAETGTRKVITDHSTVGILVTTDGSFGEISREAYVDAENRIVNELKGLNKPFVIILNSMYPESKEAETLALELEEKYRSPVALVNCLDLDLNDITHILEMLLYEFPAKEITVNLPSWLCALDCDHKLVQTLLSNISRVSGEIKNLSEASKFLIKFKNNFDADISNFYSNESCILNSNYTDIGKGVINYSVQFSESLYYNILCEKTGLKVNNQRELISVLTELAETKREFDKYASAIKDLEENNYGVVLPDINLMTIEEPQIIRQAGSFGIKLKATAPSIHMIKTNIQTEINPIVGTEEQSEELVKYIVSEYEQDPQKMWDLNIFGKNLHELFSDGLNTKLSHLSEDSREKLSETLSRVINEGSGGLICIIL